MANAEHTPGPWSVYGHVIGEVVSNDGGLVASASCPATGKHPEVLANARLIAAAPELLEACEDCLEGRGDWGAKMSAAVARARGEDGPGLRETAPRSCMIAAAPDMLAALKGAFETLSRPEILSAHPVGEARTEIYDAIAKAEGR